MTIVPIDVYASAGPYATVYLDATRSTAEGAREVELRWRAQRDELAAAGEDERTLAAMDEVVGGHQDIAGPHGQVVVAAEGAVRLDAVLPQPPLRAQTRWAPLPHLLPYLAQRGPDAAYVLAVADRKGADLWTATAAVASEGGRGDHDVAEGSVTYPIHKTASVDWSERHFQNRVDNTEATNAREVAHEVGQHVTKVGARMVIVAGDSRARALVRDDLAHVLQPNVAVIEVDAGARGDQSPAADRALDDAVRDALLHHVWRERREVLDKLQQGIGRGDFAVAGVSAVIDAVRRAQADTVVISDDPTSTLKAWVGPEALQFGSTAEELHDIGVDDPQEDRFDAALVRAIAGSGAGLLVTPNAHNYVDDGVAALLRYTDASTG